MLFSRRGIEDRRKLGANRDHQRLAGFLLRDRDCVALVSLPDVLPSHAHGNGSQAAVQLPPRISQQR